MKKVFLLIVFAVMSVAAAFGQEPEVSKRKDVSVFGVYSSYNMPSAAVMYFDDKMIGIFNSMKRFKVIGYQYRLDETSAVKFIESIKKMKEEQAYENKDYMDEDLGVVIIPGEEFKKLVNSFFIIIPSISGWKVTEAKIKKTKVDKYGNTQAYWVIEHTAEVSLSVKILNADGDLMEIYNRTETKKSEKGAQDAYRKAIDSALSGLNLWLRKTDEFKLKTKVLQNLGSKVYLQLGKDLGVQPGYEFVLKKQLTIGEGFTSTIDAGLVRVQSIGDNFSTAVVLKGAPQANDQLIESAMAGGRTMLYGGVSPFNSTLTSLVYTTGTFSNNTTFTPRDLSIDLGLAAEFEIGYALLSRAAVGIMLNDPLAFYFDLGVGYEIYFGMMSIVPEIDLSIAGTYINMGEAWYDSGSGYEQGTASLTTLYFGIKPRISFNIQASQKFKIRLYGSYAIYSGLSTSLNWTPDATDGESVDVTDQVNNSVTLNGAAKTLDDISDYINLSGLGYGLELVFRF